MTHTTVRHDHRHRAGRAAAVGVVALVLAAGLGSPAQAATPAVAAQGSVESTFGVDEVQCTLTGSDPAGTTPVVKVASSGKKSFQQSASGSASAVDMGDPSDTVTLKSTNTVKGSISGSGGAFSSMSTTFTQSIKITQSQGLFSSCDPQVTAVGIVQAAVHVKKKGKITATLVVPKGGFAQLSLVSAGGTGGTVVNYLRSGRHTLVLPVQPGDYNLSALVQSIAMFDDPIFALEVSGKGSFTASYQKS